MKPYFVLGFSMVILASCSSQKQRSNITGRTDDVYFTVNDTRKKAEKVPPIESAEKIANTPDPAASWDPDGYTGTYANRIRYFRTGRFYFDNNRPSLAPSLNINYYAGWNLGLTYVNPRFGYITGFNSPFSPYYGLYMPYYNPFYAYGYYDMWAVGFYPRYYFNPYFYYPCYYGFGNNLYSYPYYNPGYNNFYNNSQSRPSAQSVRRTGTSNNVPSSNTSTNTPQNSTQPSKQNSGSKWFNGGNSDRSGGSSGSSGGSTGTSGGGNSGGNKDRGTSGSGGSQRRR